MKRYPPVIMATAVIPWNERMEFMKDVFIRQIEHLIEKGIRNIYLFGTAGEGYAVSNRQFMEITSCFADISGPLGFAPMVGLIDLSVPRMKEKAEYAYALGIREFQFSLPAWGVLNDLETDNFFAALLDSYPDCLFLNYNLPRTKRFLEPEELFRLAEMHSNLAAVKYTRGHEKDFKSIASSGTPLQFFVTEQNFMELSKLTDCGLLMSVGNIDIPHISEFVDLCRKGLHMRAAAHLDVFIEIRDILKETVNFSAIDGAYDKMFTKYIMDEFPLRLLPPYQYVTDESFDTFRTAVYSIFAKHPFDGTDG